MFNINDAIDQAGLLSRKGKHEEAKRLYDRVLAVSPGNKRAKKGLKALRQATGNSLGPADFARVQRLLDSDKLREAIVELRKLCRANPNQPALINLLGVALSRSGDPQAASEAFKQAVALKADFWQAIHNLATTYTALGHYKEALRGFQILVNEGQVDVDVYTNLAQALRHDGQLDNAIEALQRALQLTPLSVAAHCGLGDILCDKGEFGEALLAYENALAVQPDSRQAQQGLALAKEKLAAA